jgi:DUF4097 and DUF4098 domain-containing protein YvlB
MKDKLKEYITEHRSAFDDLQPPDLWASIDGALQNTGGIIKPKNLTNMIKYGFGASVLVITTAVAIYLGGGTKQNVKLHKEITNVQPQAPAPENNFERTRPAAMEKESQHKGPAIEPPQEKMNAVADTELVTLAPTPAPPVPPQLSQVVMPSDDTLSESIGHQSVDTIFKGVKKLEVQGNFCNITVKGHTADHLRLQGEMKEGCGDMLMFGTKAYKKSECVIKYKQENDVLKVWIENIALKKRVTVSIDANSTSVLDFEVPEGVELNINNSSGNIAVEGSKGKTIDLKTKFGNLTLNNITGETNLRTSSGNIKANRITGNVTSKTDFGNGIFEDITGNLNVHSSSGHVTVFRLKGNGDVKTSFGNQKYSEITGELKTVASSGNIKIQHLEGNLVSNTSFGTQQFEDIKGDIRAEASSGNIKIEGSKGNLALSTSFGSIKGSNVQVVSNSNFKASSGNIAIDFLNELKDFHFDLRSSSGSVCVGEGAAKSTSDKLLQVGEGAIVITGNTTFGHQVYK